MGISSLRGGRLSARRGQRVPEIPKHKRAPRDRPGAWLEERGRGSRPIGSKNLNPDAASGDDLYRERRDLWISKCGREEHLMGRGVWERIDRKMGVVTTRIAPVPDKLSRRDRDPSLDRIWIAYAENREEAVKISGATQEGEIMLPRNPKMTSRDILTDRENRRSKNPTLADPSVNNLAGIYSDTFREEERVRRESVTG